MRRGDTHFSAVAWLVERGVGVLDPSTVYIGPEVNLDHISSDGVVIYPGCRICGEDTVLCAGVKLGAEAPVTVENCALGPGVELRGGYFRQSVFLDRVTVGAGAHVREGCLLEEEASGAHCVGIKQTILFPFVTLGSLVNFCDCLMAGGTSRRDHSEVGSSFVHFNYTPLGHKATPSLFGDVPQGVMLNQPRIFLGGQSGVVGPVRVAYGTVLAAGSILRHDVLEPDRLVVAPLPEGRQREWRPHARGLTRVVANNVYYLANLAALRAWYEKVRSQFFGKTELGRLVYRRALSVLALAREERLKRLRELAELVERLDLPTSQDGVLTNTAAGRVRSFRVQQTGLAHQIEVICDVFTEPEVWGAVEQSVVQAEEDFLRALEQAADPSADYLSTIGSLPEDIRAKGVAWLRGIVEGYVKKAGLDVALG